VSVSPVFEEPAWPADAVEVGRILGAWGIKGWVRVQPFSSDPQALFSSKRWFAKGPDGVPGPALAWPSLLKVREAREQGDSIVAGLQDVDDRNAAEALKGVRLFVSRQSFPTAPTDEYYWVDLIGLNVVNTEGQTLGVVHGLLDSGAQSVMQVRDPASPDAERLVPFVAPIVVDVSLERRQVTVDWGLDY
jgi:16S rRNA processing protein RimM